MNTQEKTPWTLRKLDESELDDLYINHIEKDFPSAERPSLPAMHLHMQKNLQQILVMTDGSEDAAYAACAHANGLVLVTLLAVFEGHRGGGRGTALLGLLREYYADVRAIVLEVEDPEFADDYADREIRNKRVSFYERNGYRRFEGVRHVSFGVRLELMGLPIKDTFDQVRIGIVEDIQAVYRIILPESRWERVVTSEVGDGYAF